MPFRCSPEFPCMSSFVNRRRIRSALQFGPIVVWVLAVSCAAAGGSDRGGQWHQFHGPKRDNISTAKDLLKQWPKGGPRLLWRYSECGRGFSGVSIADGMIFTAGDFGRDEIVLALDMDGKPLWKAQNGKGWRGPYPGARTTPTYDNGVLYHLNPTGRLAAFQAKTGKEIWSLELREKFNARPGTWAMAENVLIDGKRLFCVPGGSKGRIVALDKTTGEPIWVNTEVADGPAYCSPLLVTHNGTRQLITVMQKTIVSVDVGTGKLLWTHEHETKHDQNVTMPIFRDGHVFASSGHGTGGKLLKLSPRSDGVARLWLNKDLDNCHGGVVLLGGCFYGSGCRLYHKGLVCVDYHTGKTMWTHRALGPVSLGCADGMLYCLSRTGRLSLVAVSPERCRVVSHFNIPRGSRDLHLAHPVICGGRLYIRHANDLFAYDVAAQ